MSEIVIDVGARRLRRDGHEVHLSPKAFELLLILVTNRPNAVPHQRLQASLWPGVHVSETSLPALTTQLRKALGDTSEEGHVIRTLHRVGYAFIGEAVIAGTKPAVTVPVCRLLWHREVIEVSAGESVLGRDRGCAARIDADSVSRRHARLTVSGDGVTLEDLGSKNGTWVEGERIDGRVSLADGARFRLGSETLRLELTLEERPTRTATVDR